MLLRGRPKVLVLNKVDLADESNSKQVIKELKRCGEREVLFSNMRKQHHRSVREVGRNISTVEPQNVDAFGTRGKCPDYRGVLISGSPHLEVPL